VVAPWCNGCAENPAMKAVVGNRLFHDDTLALFVAQKMVAHYQHGARRRGIDFDLKPEDLMPLPISCGQSGYLLSYGPFLRSKAWPHPVRDGTAASLDRTDSNVGYRVGNVQIVSLRYNLAKLDGDDFILDF
jgi:hypothetical protein